MALLSAVAEPYTPSNLGNEGPALAASSAPSDCLEQPVVILDEAACLPQSGAHQVSSGIGSLCHALAVTGALIGLGIVGWEMFSRPDVAGSAPASKSPSAVNHPPAKPWFGRQVTPPTRKDGNPPVIADARPPRPNAPAAAAPTPRPTFSRPTTPKPGMTQLEPYTLAEIEEQNRKLEEQKKAHEKYLAEYYAEQERKQEAQRVNQERFRAELASLSADQLTKKAQLIQLMALDRLLSAKMGEYMGGGALTPLFLIVDLVTGDCRGAILDVAEFGVNGNNYNAIQEFKDKVLHPLIRHLAAQTGDLESNGLVKNLKDVVKEYESLSNQWIQAYPELASLDPPPAVSQAQLDQIQKFLEGSDLERLISDAQLALTIKGISQAGGNSLTKLLKRPPKPTQMIDAALSRTSSKAGKTSVSGDAPSPMPATQVAHSDAVPKVQSPANVSQAPPPGNPPKALSPGEPSKSLPAGTPRTEPPGGTPGKKAKTPPITKPPDENADSTKRLTDGSLRGEQAHARVIKQDTIPHIAKAAGWKELEPGHYVTKDGTEIFVNKLAKHPKTGQPLINEVTDKRMIPDLVIVSRKKGEEGISVIDHVWEGSEKHLKKTDGYAKALEKAYGLPVKEKYDFDFADFTKQDVNK